MSETTRFPMRELPVSAKFDEFDIPAIAARDETVIVPAVKGTPLLKYGIHAYYFYNFKTLKAVRVTVKHSRVIMPGLDGFFHSNPGSGRRFHVARSLFEKYHFGFNIMEQLMLMTVPHCVTDMGKGRYFINLWSYFGFFDVDCVKRGVKYVLIADRSPGHVLGSQQYYDKSADETYFVTYSLGDSFKRIGSAGYPVSCRILKRSNRSGETDVIWSGPFADYVHEIVVNADRRYCVICELGMYKGPDGGILPSRVLVLGLANGRTWEINRFLVAAHAQFDPEDPDVIYFSSHNFNFEHSGIVKLLREASYGIRFHGPASVFKYRLTADGPVEAGVFTRDDFFRLTNFHVFRHRGTKVLAAIGSPNFLFIADAESMEFMKKIEIRQAAKGPCAVGTFAPSADGEKLYVHANRSFQVIDLAGGKPDIAVDLPYNHTCSNHMIVSPETGW